MRQAFALLTVAPALLACPALALVRDVVVARGNMGLDSLRLVVDDDSEVTRELVKLYMLEGPPEVVRDGVMFAAARVSGGMRPVTVH